MLEFNLKAKAKDNWYEDYFTNLNKEHEEYLKAKQAAQLRIVTAYWNDYYKVYTTGLGTLKDYV